MAKEQEARHKAAKALADDLLSKIEDLAHMMEQFEELPPDEFNPLGLFGQATDAQGRGPHIAGGLLLATLVAWRYHQHEVSPKVFDTVKGHILELAMELVELKRSPRKRSS